MNNQPQVLDPAVREKISTRVSLVGIAGNIILMSFKIFAGVAAHSSAMLSDGIHSASDVLATFIVMVSMKYASKAADDQHPYGHERFECVASILLSFVLCAAGAGIGIEGVKKVAGLEPAAVPGILALIAAVVSIVCKEAMYRYTIRAARKINSSALTANAWDHRSDAFSSIGSFAGILGAILGFPRLDAAASLLIAFFILRVAYHIFKDAIDKMMDRACDASFIEQVRGAISREKDVLNIDSIKTRLFGDRIYVDVEIAVDGQKTLEDAHQVAHSVHNRIEAEFPQVKHCMVHVNPAKPA